MLVKPGILARWFSRPKPVEKALHPQVERVAVHLSRLGDGIGMRVESEEIGLTLMLPKRQAVELVDAILDMLNFEVGDLAS